MAVLLIVHGGGSVAADGRGAPESEAMHALAQLPFAVEAIDHFESIGSCESQARVIGFVSSLSVEQVAHRLFEWASADPTQRRLAGRQQQVVWSTWWQGKQLLTAVVRPSAGFHSAASNSGYSRGLLILSVPERTELPRLKLPSNVPPELVRAHELAAAVPGLALDLASDDMFRHLLANGRLSCSSEGDQNHWTLVGQVPMPVERVRAHLASLLASQWPVQRQLDDGANLHRALLLATGRNRQLLIGLFGTQAATGVVIHSIERSGATSQIGQRARASQ